MEERELCWTTPRDSAWAKAQLGRQGEAHTTAGEACAKTGRSMHGGRKVWIESPSDAHLHGTKGTAKAWEMAVVTRRSPLYCTAHISKKPHRLKLPSLQKLFSFISKLQENASSRMFFLEHTGKMAPRSSSLWMPLSTQAVLLSVGSRDEVSICVSIAHFQCDSNIRWHGN